MAEGQRDFPDTWKDLQGGGLLLSDRPELHKRDISEWGRLEVNEKARLRPGDCVGFADVRYVVEG